MTDGVDVTQLLFVHNRLRLDITDTVESAVDHLDGAVESDAAEDDALDPELGELARDLFFFGTAPRLRAAAIALSSSGTVSEMVLTAAFLGTLAASLFAHGEDDLLEAATELEAEDPFRPSSTLWRPLCGVEM